MYINEISLKNIIIPLNIMSGIFFNENSANIQLQQFETYSHLVLVPHADSSSKVLMAHKHRHPVCQLNLTEKKIYINLSFRLKYKRNNSFSAYFFKNKQML